MDSYFFFTPEVQVPRCSRKKETPAVVIPRVERPTIKKRLGIK